MKRKFSPSDKAPAKRHHATPLSRAPRLPLHPGRGVRGETKAVDLLPATYAFDTTGSVTAINLIRTGTSFNNRIGRKIAMKSLYINGKLQAESAPAYQSYCRMIVVYDTQPNGALPTWANVVTSYDQALNTSSTVTDGVNLDFRDRFRIILDHRITLPEVTASGDPSTFESPTATEMTIQEFRLLGNLETQFKADSSPAVIGDIATGSLVLLTLGDQAAGGGWAFNGTVRLRFTDN